MWVATAKARFGQRLNPEPRLLRGDWVGLDAVTDTPPSAAARYDSWYSNMAAAPAMDGIVQRHLGLPPDLLSTSLLSWEGIGELAAALRLRSGALLVDLACGRGG